MSRPSTKDDLLAAAVTQYQKLAALLAEMPSQALTAEFSFEDRDRNIRDVLIHLYEWHQLLLDWVRSNQAGDAKPFLPAPYNWKTYGQLNLDFREHHQRTSLEQSRQLLSQSHAEVLSLIEGFTNEELFSKQHFNWTGTTSLGSYCVSATSSHYDWALKKLRKHQRSHRP